MDTSELETVLTDDADRVETLVADGYCPIECSIGGRSIVDELVMDHHGERSDLEPVSVRAYRDHWGARREDPRFVGVGEADADMCFAVASLAGLLPHPDREVPEHLPEHVRRAKTRDLKPLAETIGVLDEDPIGRNPLELPKGKIVIAWKTLSEPAERDGTALVGGADLWRRLVSGHPALSPLIEGAEESERQRHEQALEDLEQRAETIGDVLVIRGSTLFGFPEWYDRDLEGGDPDEVDGWGNPVVMAWSHDDQSVTIGCPNDSVAEQVFGDGGLKNVFDELPGGWGGRESVGGSPRGESLDWDQVREAVETVDEMMREV